MTRRPAPAPLARKLRCAVYTRKSTEHNLDLEFNSLDAQREACEAYIKSQAHEGWRLLPDHYDDGGLSGASLNRPALQILLGDVQAGKVDIVVVYKVDRLTRSLTDFAKLVELFDRHEVSFVSVTQSFNTTTSMGRLTLNVLLSFAQFEREVIGERVRDKIAASKRKGIWVGGPVSLGYTVINKKLVIVPEEAETVRTIFRRYLELGSVGSLVQNLDRTGIRTKRRVLASGRVVGGGRFGVGALAHLLRNRVYIGEVVYRGEIHTSDSEPILERELFESVQAKLSGNAVERKLHLRNSPSLLTGRIFDAEGNRMTPSHTTKNGVRYRYYISHALLQKKTQGNGAVARVPAPDIEAITIDALRIHEDTMDAPSQRSSDDRALIDRYVDRVVVKPDTTEIVLTGADDLTAATGNGSRTLVFNSRWTRPDRAVNGIVRASKHVPTLKPETQEALLAAIGKARGWIDDIMAGRVTSLQDIAGRERKVERHIRLLAPLAFLSPHAVRLVLDGTFPSPTTVTGLAKNVANSWRAQQSALQLGD